jgi:osmotically-inducible protein OsmY
MFPIRHHRSDAVGEQLLPDRDIKATIVSRLRENPYTQGTRIKVSVHHGVVRLEGSLPSQLARTAAMHDLEAVPGITDLDLDLKIAA